MSKHHLRMYLQQDGKLYIEDMSPLELEIVSKLGISLENLSENKNEYITIPKYAALKSINIPRPLPDNIEGLLALHDFIIDNHKEYDSFNAVKGLSIFSLKKRILEYYLKACNLCGYRCGGLRASSGLCPITTKTFYHQHFIHLGEEKEIGKTLAIELIGCNIRCKFCQKGELISQTKGLPFTHSLWKEIRREYKEDDFNNISFLGGNPDQSVSGVLDFLSQAPRWASTRPIVWHTNAYATPPLYNLLKGLIDLWIVDFKYFSDNCAMHLSCAPDYISTAKTALRTICKILSPSVPVIVRHLILPGHWECCQRPLVKWLATMKNEIIFHPMQQYRPLWHVRENVGELGRRISETEFQRVLEIAKQSGLITTGLATDYKKAS